MQECGRCLAATEIVKPATAVHVHSNAVVRLLSNKLLVAEPLPSQPEAARQCLCAKIDEPVAPIAAGLDEQECALAEPAERFRERLLMRVGNGRRCHRPQSTCEERVRLVLVLGQSSYVSAISPASLLRNPKGCLLATIAIISRPAHCFQSTAAVLSNLYCAIVLGAASGDRIRLFKARTREGPL